MEDNSFLMTYNEKTQKCGDFTSYKPKFQGKLEGYHENSIIDIILRFIMVFVVLGISTGLWIGFVKFSLYNSTLYIYVMFIVLIIYIVVILFMTLFGSFEKRKMEKLLLQNKIKQKENEKQQKLEKEEANRQLLQTLK